MRSQDDRIREADGGEKNLSTRRKIEQSYRSVMQLSFGHYPILIFTKKTDALLHNIKASCRREKSQERHGKKACMCTCVRSSRFRFSRNRSFGRTLRSIKHFSRLVRTQLEFARHKYRKCWNVVMNEPKFLRFSLSLSRSSQRRPSRSIKA